MLDLLSEQGTLSPHASGVDLHGAILKAAPRTTLLNLDTLAADIARKNAGRLAVALTEARRRTIADIVAMGIEQGWSKEDVQRRIKDSIGLDPRRVRAVENYRKQLLKDGKPKGTANRLARAYSGRLVAQRAGIIADHEGRQAIADAQRQLWQEMRDMGHVTPYAVRVTKGQNDVRKCPQCKKENGRRRSLKTEEGGPPFHPQCRCWEELEDRGIVKADLTMRSWDEIKGESDG